MLDYNTKIQLFQTDPHFVSSWNHAPLPEDQYLTARLGQDYTVYKQLKRDPHVHALLQKRRLAILGRQVLVKPASDKLVDRKAAELTEQLLNLINYEQLCSDAVEGMLPGYSAQAIDYSEQDGLILPSFTPIANNRITFAFPSPDDTIPFCTDEPLTAADAQQHRGYEVRLLTKRSPLTGERFPKHRVLIYSFGSGEGNPWGLGLGYQIYKWWFAKNLTLDAWILLSDRLGSPPIAGEHPPEYDDGDEHNDAILDAWRGFLKAVSPNGWIDAPTGFKANLLGDAAVSSADVHQRLLDECDHQISEAILNEAPFSDSNSSSRAANESQNDDRERNLTDGDCNLLDEQMQGFWTYLLSLNAPRAKAPTVRRWTTADAREQQEETRQQDALLSRANRDKVLIDAGFSPTPEYVQKTYGTGWQLAQSPVAASALPPSAPSLDMAEPIAVKGTDTLTDDEWDALAEVDEQDLAIALDGWQQSAPDRFKRLLEAGEA